MSACVPCPFSGSLSRAGLALFADCQLPGGDTGIRGTTAGTRNERGDPSILRLHSGQITPPRVPGAAQRWERPHSRTCICF